MLNIEIGLSKIKNTRSVSPRKRGARKGGVCCAFELAYGFFIFLKEAAKPFFDNFFHILNRTHPVRLRLPPLLRGDDYIELAFGKTLFREDTLCVFLVLYKSFFRRRTLSISHKKSGEACHCQLDWESMSFNL